MLIRKEGDNYIIYGKVKHKPLAVIKIGAEVDGMITLNLVGGRLVHPNLKNRANWNLDN